MATKAIVQRSQYITTRVPDLRTTRSFPTPLLPSFFVHLPSPASLWSLHRARRQVAPSLAASSCSWYFPSHLVIHFARPLLIVITLAPGTRTPLPIADLLAPITASSSYHHRELHIHTVTHHTTNRHSLNLLTLNDSTDILHPHQPTRPRILSPHRHCTRINPCRTPALSPASSFTAASALQDPRDRPPQRSNDKNLNNISTVSAFPQQPPATNSRIGKGTQIR